MNCCVSKKTIFQELLDCLTPAPYEFTDQSTDDLTETETLHLEPMMVTSPRGHGPPMVGGGHHRRQLSHSGPSRPREVHPHSRSTETILFHNDKDPHPIVPNKKPGTPDIWLPRTIRA